MKNLIITLALIFSVNIGAQAQFLYNGTTAKGNNVTYRCVHDRSIVRIHSVNNVYEDVTPRRSDGAPIGLDEMIKVAEPATISNIFSEIFSPSEQAALEYMRDLTIGYTINVSSGAAMEVNFMFLNRSNWAKVPPDKFYLFEQKIKQRMKFKLSDNQKKQNVVKALF